MSIVYVTGTDTGVGKTIFTGLLFSALRARRIPARTLKPFSSGGREDAELFWKLEQRERSLDEINPFYFQAPIAPAIAARIENRKISLTDVAVLIRHASIGSTCLLVEGAGGLLSPLGDNYSLAGLISHLPGFVLIVAKNQLGVINHALLTIQALQSRGISQVAVVLMDHPGARDRSIETNASAIRQYSSFPLFELAALDPLPQSAKEFAAEAARQTAVFDAIINHLNQSTP